MTESPIVISNSRVRAEILPLGATLHRLQVPDVRMADGPASWRDILLSRSDISHNDTFQYGATIGRFANRIARSRIAIDGTEYPLDANEGVNQVHGGPVGFSDIPWRVIGCADDKVELGLISPDGDQGFPGTLTVTATFSLIENGVRVMFSATTDKPTVLNLTTHPYFNLGGETIDDHRLQVAASQFTPTTLDELPTGEILPVAGTALDLREPRLMRDVLADLAATGLQRSGALNQNFVVDGTGLRVHVRVFGPDGLAVEIASDAPGVQVYSLGNFGRRGLAVEPEDFPDAPNQPAFPSTVLRPGKTYSRTIEWRVI